MKHGHLIGADALMEAINTLPKFGVDERGRTVPWNEGYEPYIRLRDVVITITGMPTIEPERKTGKWIRHPEWQEDGECGYECDQCGMGSDVNYNFCMRCGAKMEEE